MNNQAIETEIVEPSNAIALRDKSEVAKTEANRPTAQELRTVEVNEALLPAYQKASTLELTEAEIEALQAPFPDELIEIRPHDGLIFLPHIHVSNRLNKVIKPGKWALICRRHWLEGNTMYGEYILVIRGCYVGESVGGHPYQPNNPKVNYSDTLESTAAEALRRICGKRLSCGSQVWEPEYARQWIAKYAFQAGGKWGRKGTTKPQEPRFDSKPTQAPAPAIKTPPSATVARTEATPEQRDKMISIINGEGQDAIQRALRYFIQAGAILPSESLLDIPLHWIPTTQSQFRDLGVLIAKMVDTDKADRPAWVSKAPTNAPKAAPKPPLNEPSEDAFNPVDEDEPPATQEPLPLTDAQSEPWYDVVVPVPRKNQKRDDYMKNPDTIGSLYEARHDDEDARKRLWGFVSHYEPKGWTGRDGKERPPSEADKKFRQALDDYADYAEKHKD